MWLPSFHFFSIMVLSKTRFWETIVEKTSQGERVALSNCFPPSHLCFIIFLCGFAANPTHADFIGLTLLDFMLHVSWWLLLLEILVMICVQNHHLFYEIMTPMLKLALLAYCYVASSTFLYFLDFSLQPLFQEFKIFSYAIHSIWNKSTIPLQLQSREFPPHCVSLLVLLQHLTKVYFLSFELCLCYILSLLLSFKGFYYLLLIGSLWEF